MQKWALCSAVALAGPLGAGQALAASSPPFVDNGDGTVTDASTGLMWDQCAEGLSGNGDCANGLVASYISADAMELAATRNNFNYKGYCDWRVPSIVELETLVKGSTSPTIDTVAFPNTPGLRFWSSWCYEYGTGFACNVHFGGGNPGGRRGSNAVRLVRGGQYLGSFSLFSTAASATTVSTATLTATSPVAATGYWLVVPRAATPPTPAQVMAGVSYGSVTVAVGAAGTGTMAAKSATSFSATGLVAGTDYDAYIVATESTYSTRTGLVGPVSFSTLAISTSSIVIDPVTPTTLYAGLDGAGVYKKTSLTDWTAASTQPTNLNVKALAIKSDSSMLFAGTDGGGVFKSSNSGVDWAVCKDASNVANSGLTNLNLRSLALTGTTVYAGTTAGVFVSSNDCASWAALNTGMP